MDNLAHSFTAGVVGAALLPETTRKYKWRTFFASAAVANFPDIDFVLTLVSREFYFYHHRGFTHSLTGLLIIFPICYWIFQKIMKPAMGAPADTGGVSRSEAGIFVLAQLLFTHFFLDYLTTYGTMFLFPFSKIRFSWPLMFILDPLFWLVTGFGFVIIYLRPLSTRKNLIVRAWSCLALIFGLWVFEASYKFKAESIYRQSVAQAADSEGALSPVSETESQGHLISYPAPGAPFFWLFVDEKDSRLSQGALSWISPERKPWYFWKEPIPETFSHGALCPEDGMSAKALNAFEDYRDWAGPLVCSAYTFLDQDGCRCLSLKYSLVAQDAVAYGAWWVSKDGSAHQFLPPDPLKKLLGYYRLFLPVDGLMSLPDTEHPTDHAD